MESGSPWGKHLGKRDFISGDEYFIEKLFATISLRVFYYCYLCMLFVPNDGLHK